MVSNPNGLPRPFRQRIKGKVASPHYWVSNPNGLPRPFRQSLMADQDVSDPEFQTRTGFPGHSDNMISQLRKRRRMVSNPNGLPRPFRQLSFEEYAELCAGGFKPERASQAIPTLSIWSICTNEGMFQTRTGF